VTHWRKQYERKPRPPLSGSELAHLTVLLLAAAAIGMVVGLYASLGWHA